MMRDQSNELKIVRSISPVSVGDNTAQVGQIVDHAGFYSATYAILLGSLADADMTSVVLLEHGDAANLSDAAAVPDEQLIGTELGAAFQFDDDNKCTKLGYVGGKRYTRLTITPAANASAALLAACCILGRPVKGPQSTQKV